MQGTKSCPENGEDETNSDPPRSVLLLLLLPKDLKLVIWQVEVEELLLWEVKL